MAARKGIGQTEKGPNSSFFTFHSAASAAAEGLQTALAAYEAALPARRALEAYYESPLWQEDFAAEVAAQMNMGK